MPKFSIIIPSFNRADVVSMSIQSIFNQSFSDWELILVDDGSNDHTSEVVLPFINKQGFKYIYQENTGVSQARNVGALNSTGYWLIFLDSDDELTRDSLKYFDYYINQNPQEKLFVAGNERKTSSVSEIRLPKEGSYNPFLSGTFCIRKEVFDQIGGYDPKFTFSENTELFHRLRQNSISPFFIPTVSLIYHENSAGGSKNLENIIQSVSLFLRKHQNSMSAHHKYLYNQIVGVNQLRVHRFNLARKSLWKAYLFKPWKIQTLARLGLSFMPSISKRIYTNKISS